MVKSDLTQAASSMERSLPKNYRSVYNLMSEAGHGHHFNAYDLFVRLRERREPISQTTVYRALERLVALRLVDEVNTPNAKHVVYEVAAPLHAHFFCRICGALHDVALDVAEKELLANEALAGMDVERTVMTFEGRCRRCM